MKADDLLLVLSAREKGSWEQFRRAFDSVHLDEVPDDGSQNSDTQTGIPEYQTLRLNLERLAHVEFFSPGCSNDWQIAPPVLAECVEMATPTAVLCGARSDGLVKKLKETAAKVVGLAERTQNESPIAYLVSGERTELRKFARNIGVIYQPNAPMSILSLLSPVSPRGSTPVESPPMGRDWRVEEFDPKGLTWKDCTRDDAMRSKEGLFRFRWIHQWLHFACIRGECRRIHAAEGKYWRLHRKRRKVLSYLPEQAHITMPATCRPPMLIDRALTLCSGLLPVFDPASSNLRYQNIPAAVAKAVARLLHQEV